MRSGARADRGVFDLAEPTREQLINYISATMDFYERGKDVAMHLLISKYRRYLLHVAFMCHTSEYVFDIVLCMSHGYPPGDVEQLTSSGY